MLCQKCGKNEAEVYLVQTLNGERTEALLCAVCAAENGFGASPISFTSFLQSFIGEPGVMGFAEKYDEELKCGVCGQTLTEIKRTGKAGCAECYSVFKTQMETIIKNVQAGNTHTGKYPKKAGYVSVNREIGALRNELTQAVEKEEFEKAAALRDRIKALESACKK